MSGESPFQWAVDLSARVLVSFRGFFADRCLLHPHLRRKLPRQCPTEDSQVSLKYHALSQIQRDTYHVDYCGAAAILLGLLELLFLSSRVKVFRSTNFDIHLIGAHEVG